MQENSMAWKVRVYIESGIVQATFKSLGSLLGNAIMVILVGVQTKVNDIVSAFYWYF